MDAQQSKPSRGWLSGVAIHGPVPDGRYVAVVRGKNPKSGHVVEVGLYTEQIAELYRLLLDANAEAAAKRWPPNG